MSEYLDTMFNETKEINYTAHELKALSRAFYATGNIAMGETLSCIAGSLLESSDKINKAVGQEVTDRCNQTQQATANMVSAALAACRMGDA